MADGEIEEDVEPLTIRGSIASQLLFLLIAAPALLNAQLAELPERLGTDWVLAYEQAYGIGGLYVDEPPLDTTAAKIREDLLTLTKAGRAFQERIPSKDPDAGILLSTGFLERRIVPPDGMEFVWSRDSRRFLSSAGREYDIVFGALAQFTAAESYRERVFNGGRRVQIGWQKLLEMEDVPALIQREIETRRFVIDMTEYQGLRDLQRTQELLRKLADAIEFATATGEFKPGQEITMQDVGRTGLIATLRALPLGGQYKVTRVGEPPVAVFGEVEIKLNPNAISDRMKSDAEDAWRKRPTYPPAMALAARYREGRDALSVLDQAIKVWPDVMALRIQRLSMNASRLDLAALNEDLDYVLARFPPAPLLLEIDVATRKGPLAVEPEFRSTIATTMADIRPEVLNVQLLAYRELVRANKFNEANRIRDRLLQRHPGYEPLIPTPEEVTKSEHATETTTE